MDKAYLITGAAGGVGQAVVKKFSEHGEKMVLLGRNEEKLEKLKAETKNVAACIRYDLEDVRDIETVFQECISQGILLQGLIHCAGLNQGMPVKINDVDAMERMMQIIYFPLLKWESILAKKNIHLRVVQL